jgi:uncharacterized membrane-anchored protein
MVMRFKVLAVLALAAGLGLASAEAAPKGDPKAQAANVSGGRADAEAKARDAAYPWEKTLTRRTGVIDLPAASARLNMGEGYYFLGPEDSRKVIVDGWGNPPNQADNVLGMIFPKGMSPMDEGSWGAVVTWNPSGYVDDKDAKTADYTKILQALKDGEKDDNDARAKAGFKPIHLVGWAEPPSYDPAHHVVIWARQLESEGVQGLNYDVRVLGRKGVLSLNIVGAMSGLTEIRAAAQGVRDTAQFNAGERYADFKPGLDKTAGYGIAGLVAAGLGVAAVKKVGLIGVILLFAKKGIALIVAAFAGAGAWLRNLFGGGKGPKNKGGGDAPPSGGSGLNLGGEPPPPSPPPTNSGGDIVS